MRRIEPTTYLYAYCIIAMLIVLGAFWMLVHVEVQRDAACEAHGWERAQTRGGLCVDDAGVVRAP